MEEWNVVKRRIDEYDSLNKNIHNWLFRYSMIRDQFYKISMDDLYYHSQNDEDKRVRDIGLNRFNILKDYTIREDFNNVVTLKLFIPSSCNAKCSFCYMNDYGIKIAHDKEAFLNNFIDSITKLLLRLDSVFPVSLDITGNEPTFDVDLLKEVFHKLRNYKYLYKIDRITMTTNGFNLDKVLNDLYGVVDYVNISIHDYVSSNRDKIFGTKILSDDDLKDIVLNLHDKGIDTSAVSVIHKDIDNFTNFMENFISYCKDIGFKSLRFRNDVFWKDSKFLEYMKIGINKYHVIQSENTNDSTWCRLSDDNGFFIFFLKGVIDTSLVSKGIEYVINDDGIIYADFYKRTKLDDYQYPVDFIFDKK